MRVLLDIDSLPLRALLDALPKVLGAATQHEVSLLVQEFAFLELAGRLCLVLIQRLVDPGTEHHLEPAFFDFFKMPTEGDIDRHVSVVLDLSRDECLLEHSDREHLDD